jgi:nucleotide-binding universal stress UspA family protein
MKHFASLLVPLDGSRAAARTLGCATWLASSLHAKLHILCATRQALSAREEIVRLHVPEAYWEMIILHQTSGAPDEAILAAAAKHDANLIIMSSQGETADRQPETFRQSPNPFAAVGHVTRAIIERSAAPVLLMPPHYREDLPWKRVLTPLSGEDADEALMLAITLANALELEVHVVHVLDEPARDRGLASTVRYADAVHHEYPQQLAELVRRAAPGCTRAECQCITEVALSRGDVLTQLREHIETKHISLLVVGWRGRFITGHADVLKSLLNVVACPLLLVKAHERGPFKLRVSRELE